MLKSKHIAVYVTGGIAAYKSLSVVRELIKQDAEVRVIMTDSAQQFVTPLTFATLSKHPVLTNNFKAESAEDDFIPHIKIARWTDLAIVVPATADIIAKMANGIADDIVTTSLMATDAPKIVFPTMNTSMWNYPPVQKNLDTLQSIGIQVVQPDTGFLAEGETGKGRLVDLPEIMKAINDQLSVDKPLQNTSVIVTAGGTKEPIDPVRFIGNNSSGKMGIAMAESAAKRGADVTLLSTVNYTSKYQNLQVINVTSANDILNKLETLFPENDVLIMAAAIADFKPVTVADQKIKKTDDQPTYSIKLVKNPDILKTIASNKTNQFVVGFAAETENLIPYAERKLQQKNADVILANDVSKKDAGFNVDTNRITLVSKDEDPDSWPLMSKKDVADKFWDYYQNLN
ncbi:bifunctional phosphopantothenoylcysteine decarboxylase/phosphopantothenate--cysteine ligase CoaBC [Companilactobacillus ginsenosidimutans]|uniref:Coenzyme A biosynthesis bifunctional protein CoaBC n=1 Tax=Companilactobacillus ginsenosidimutans TaxID=1007676 RepID=A0A0H4QGM5_9LACO|nr:bifunctional phosphopantothenoylcysteine decarboxylase/phosphopantothenate--cysteine ligase CoaBC [Companilactobacillus ginsenosidimutans]AKP66161.1 phosphopantothenoylcysteine decarboxylase [Companilactobacillus ginsenosidimutans]